MFEIEFYRLLGGKAPVEDFLNGLDKKIREQALHELSILEEFGNRLREPHSKPVAADCLS